MSFLRLKSRFKVNICQNSGFEEKICPYFGFLRLKFWFFSQSFGFEGKFGPNFGFR